MLGNKKKLLGVGALLAVAVIAAGAVAATGVMDDNEQPITGEAYERATQAALAYTGGGRVTETEVGDEDSYYEVEVTLDDGSQVDVQLDVNFNVVGSKRDNDSKDDKDR